MKLFLIWNIVKLEAMAKGSHNKVKLYYGVLITLDLNWMGD